MWVCVSKTDWLRLDAAMFASKFLLDFADTTARRILDKLMIR